MYDACIIYFLHQPPQSPTHPPVLYYTVTHNVSDNGSELAFNTTTNKAILNEASYGETYYISVCGINIIGKGKIATITFTNGKRKIINLAHAHNFAHRRHIDCHQAVYNNQYRCFYTLCVCGKLFFVNSRSYSNCGTIKQSTGGWVGDCGGWCRK